MPRAPLLARIPEWLRADLRALLVALISGIVATALGVRWAYEVSLKQEFKSLRQQTEAAHHTQVERDSVEGEGFLAQLRIIRGILAKNHLALDSETLGFPKRRDLATVITVPEFGVSEATSLLPIRVLADSTIRELALDIALHERGLNVAIENRNAFQTNIVPLPIHSEGQSFSDPGPNEQRLVQSDKTLLSEHRSLIRKVDSLTALYHRHYP
jgi:hypothetical protein